MVSFRGTDQQTTVLTFAHGTALADGDTHPFRGELKDLARGVLGLASLDP
jgi:hypothetical protein